MKMAEKEQDGRIDLVASSNKCNFDLRARGQIIAMAIISVFVLLAIFLFYKEQYAAGVALLGINLGAIVIAFLTGRVPRKEDVD